MHLSMSVSFVGNAGQYELTAIDRVTCSLWLSMAGLWLDDWNVAIL